MQEQARVEGELKARNVVLGAPPALARPAKPASPAATVARPRKKVGTGPEVALEEDEEGAGPTAGQGIDYRITGFWRWKTVVVPLSVYVVPTRRGHGELLHLGMGISFSHNPNTDAFLVIPATVHWSFFSLLYSL